MRVHIIPALLNNYMYVIVDEQTNECAAVDPVEPEKIQDVVKRENLKLKYILTTHHHWDHAGGNYRMTRLFAGVEVLGRDMQIPELTRKVNPGEHFMIGRQTFECLLTPCHTSGHICYYFRGDDNEPGVVFTGDTLFVAGCGSFFEGEAKDMYHSLVNILSHLPPETKVFCGHEYTVDNLEYALCVEPDNKDLHEKKAWAKNQRKGDLPTVPSTIGEELKINPFMRVREEAVMRHARAKDPIQAMENLRNEKNTFRK